MRAARQERRAERREPGGRRGAAAAAALLRPAGGVHPLALLREGGLHVLPEGRALCAVPADRHVPRALARRVDQIDCHPPAGDAAAHFAAVYAFLHQATPHELHLAVLYPAKFRWKALRVYWRARWIGVYWHALTAKHMDIDGKYRKLDRTAFEASPHAALTEL